MRKACPFGVVALDFGGVIAEEGFLGALREWGAERGLDPEAVARAGEEAVYGTGYLEGTADEAAFRRDFFRRLGIREDPEEADRLRERILAAFVVRPEMLALSDRLRAAGLRTVIASDQTDWLEELDRRHRFYARFDRVFNSFRLGVCKRSPEFFLRMAREMGVPTGAILFTDDRRGNVEVARSTGCDAILFEDPRAFEAALFERGI